MKHWKVSIWSVWRELGAYCSNRIYRFCYKYLILWYSYIFLDKTKDLIQTSELLDKVLTKKKKKTPVHNASVNYSCDQPPPPTTAGHLPILLCPGTGHLPTPGLFPSLWYACSFLSEYNYTWDFNGNILNKHIGVIIKDRKKLKRVVKTCSQFNACIFSLRIKPESHGEIGS